MVQAQGFPILYGPETGCCETITDKNKMLDQDVFADPSVPKFLFFPHIEIQGARWSKTKKKKKVKNNHWGQVFINPTKNWKQ